MFLSTANYSDSGEIQPAAKRPNHSTATNRRLLVIWKTHYESGTGRIRKGEIRWCVIHRHPAVRAFLPGQRQMWRFIKTVDLGGR